MSLVLWTPHFTGGDTARAWVSLAARECRNMRSDTSSFLGRTGFACPQAHRMSTGKVLRAGWPQRGDNVHQDALAPGCSAWSPRWCPEDDATNGGDGEEGDDGGWCLLSIHSGQALCKPSCTSSGWILTTLGCSPLLLTLQQRKET